MEKAGLATQELRMLPMWAYRSLIKSWTKPNLSVLRDTLWDDLQSLFES
jgi:hypothetical protein